ncbi:hypothetical protein D9M68_833070 [compost metagenome]
MAQIDHEGGEQKHRQADTGTEQADGDELRRAGEYQQGHAKGLPCAETGGPCQAAENDAKWNGAQQHRQHIAGALGELVRTGHGLSS